MNIRFYCTARNKRECAYWVVVPKKHRLPDTKPKCENDIHGNCTSEMCKANAMVRELKAMGLTAKITGLEETK